ncbi:helix-turn-helix domain-containing protein [Salinilacihabitans rarus]|uniref:helix-turn-helix domain-containing protein n=1 Tax=Salinilacihabitans rarus TaxID=2961596 RepID=UPI0020C833EF|nr:helix-turn-helix domain-containing protein [Salinilacihabitans rarus]
MSRDATTTSGSNAGSSLRALLRIEPESSAGCSVLAAGTEGEDVRQNFVYTDGSAAEGGCECRAEVTVIDGDERKRRLVGSEVDGGCVCMALRRTDCVTEIEGFRDGALLVSVTVPGRDALRSVVQAVRETGATVQLRRIRDLGEADEDAADERFVEVDAREITDKQREAIRAAYDAGYFERPRRADLDDLAEELGVSPSAVSQRISAVESRLVLELLRAEDGY